nr:immunoglobulin heavy chain junction region [Macaca mulatta]MOW19697.1 immunoglobulin heavy chain junction region [Macaca mulatta]
CARVLYYGSGYHTSRLDVW